MLKREPPSSLNSSRAIALYSLLATFTVRADSPRLATLDDVEAFALAVVVQADSDERKAFELLAAHIQPFHDASTVALVELDAIAHRFHAGAAQRDANLGKPVGSVEFIGRKQVGECLVRVSYLQHRARFPMLWVLDFYRTAGGWTITALNTDRPAADLLSPGGGQDDR